MDGQKSIHGKRPILKKVSDFCSKFLLYPFKKKRKYMRKHVNTCTGARSDGYCLRARYLACDRESEGIWK